MSEAAESLPATEPALPILGSHAGGLRYELVLNATQDGFVLLHEGRLSRLFLGRIAVGAGKEVSTFALKMQNDSYPPIEASRGRQLTNRDVERMWTREREDLLRVTSPNVVQTLPMPASESLPVVFCKKTGRYFHPPSPQTGAPLRVCRDNDLLRENGLPEYTTTLRRYLYGGEASNGPTRTFYRRAGLWPDERPRKDTKVRFEADLVRDWVAIVRGGEGVPLPHAGFACAGCAHAETCYPTSGTEKAVPAQAHLIWVSFYDFQMIPLNLLDLTYDEACDLVGGADWLETYRAAIQGPRGQGRQPLLDPMTGAFSQGSQWMFRDDPKKFALEVLRLKLMMFSEVCEGVQAIHTQCNRPHFGIAPINLMAKVLPGNIGIPARWNLRVQVVDLGSPQQFRPTAPEGMAVPDILEPGGEMESDIRASRFQSPMVSKHLDCMMNLTVRERQEEGGRIHLRLETSGQAQIAALRAFRRGDAVLVSPANSGRLDSAIWAQVEEIGRTALTLTADFVGGGGDGWDAQRSLVATLAFYKNYGIPCDLYGLGMLLFRTLLVNDEQDLERVVDTVQKCLIDLARDSSGSTVDEKDVRLRFRRCLADRDTKVVMDSRSLLFTKADRDRLAGAAGIGVPQDLWDELLLFAFRLSTQIPGFSYECSHAAASPFLVKKILEDVKALLQRLHVEMFMGEMRSREILQVCNDMHMMLFEELKRGEPVPATPVGKKKVSEFSLRVEREGDVPGPQLFGPFDRDVIRIGRQKDKCDVWLDDGRISKVHARIERSSAGWVIVDSSANGTLLAGEPIPKEVPQDLQPGAVIRIQSTLLYFETEEERTDMTLTMQRDVRILDSLMAAFVRGMNLTPDDRKEVLTQVLMKHRESMRTSELLSRIDETITALGGPASGLDQASTLPGKTVGVDILARAQRALMQLSRDLLGREDLNKADDVDRFVRLLNAYVTTTGKWLVRALAFRRRIGEDFEATTGSSTIGRLTPREHTEVYQKTLDWADVPGRQQHASDWLELAYKNLESMHAGLLEGAKRMREAIRKQMDPARIESLARQAGTAFLVNMSASSALWKAYRREYGQVLDDSFEIQVLNREFKDGYQQGAGQMPQ